MPFLVKMSHNRISTINRSRDNEFWLNQPILKVLIFDYGYITKMNQHQITFPTMNDSIEGPRFRARFPGVAWILRLCNPHGPNILKPSSLQNPHEIRTGPMACPFFHAPFILRRVLIVLLFLLSARHLYTFL